MPFLKFSRDKRGYENYYLFDGKGRPRLLFWFHTPPQVKVGRTPFSDDVRRMIEAQNPGVQFDWGRIMSTPIPPPDVDYWRERRRAEKAAKRAAREADAAEAAEAAAEAAAQESQFADAGAAASEVATDETGSREDIEAVAEAVEPAAADAAPSSEVQPEQPHGHRRRRRRRRRRGGGGGGGGGGGQMPPSQPDTPPDAEV